ncbi:hypothetical protein BDF21DRAFT_494038 [Thamnidium elegans]|nr:hypothetical protein BDF21DRAFT_494038 [Thamnidium elegans]
MHLLGVSALVLATATFASAATTKPTSTSSGVLAVESPAWLPDFGVPNGVNAGYPTGALNTSKTLSHKTLDLSAYPEPWEAPSTTHAEIKAVIKAIDWTKVPKAPIVKTNSNGEIDMTKYDDSKDDYCWWSSTNCVKPKSSYLPADVSVCPNAGDWGLNYDDGPFNPIGDDTDKWAEPELYNFLAENGNQKATLFYIGSNVATFPEAAKRAINDGHVLCVHTWSHPAMTTQTNEQVVAELYWTLRAIKEATGVTTKCWRPPFGDVDDRVRAIAWQMGMQTMLWDQDTNDWDMPGDGGGKLAPSKVDGYFEDWIETRKKGTDKNGHIVLQHELNNATVKMAEKWLPKIQESFNVVSIQQCLNVTQPYWETNWVYPTKNENVTATTNTTTAVPSATVSGSAVPSTTDINLGHTATTSIPSASSVSSAQSSTTDVSLKASNTEESSASLVAVHGLSLLAATALCASYLL